MVTRVMTMRSYLALAAVGAVIPFSSCQCDDELNAVPGSLRGIVCAPSSGGAAAGVPVHVVDASGRSFDTTSDERGLWSIDRLGAGLCDVTYDGPEGIRAARVDVKPRERVDFIDAACHPPQPPPPGPTGTVEGCICDDGVGRWVDGANVYIVTADGGLVVTGTDSEGCFVLEAPAGQHVLKVDKGSFYREIDVEVTGEAPFQVPSPAVCEEPPPPAGSGIVTGRVCAPDGETWLAGAEIWVERADGTRTATTTDAQGRYRLEGVPAGEQTLHIVKGSFSSEVTVTVAAEQTTTLPESECEIEQNLRIAVVTGSFDRVEDVLASIGIERTNIDVFDGVSFAGFGDWASDLFGDIDALSQYDIVFVNCGADDFDFTFSPQQNILSNLRTFVQNGGSLYVSDQSYEIVERTWPDFIDFFGDDLRGQAAQQGLESESTHANIVDPSLAAAFGRTDVEIHYPLGAWAVVSSASSNARVMVQADATTFGGDQLRDIPHIVGFSAGSGRVIFTSFHQEQGINSDMQRILQLLIFEL